MSDLERTPAGLQMVIPGCERRTLPRSITRVDDIGQGLLSFYRPPTLREKLEASAESPLRPAKDRKRCREAACSADRRYRSMGPGTRELVPVSITLTCRRYHAAYLPARSAQQPLV
jgi:hypothetical protein